MAAPKALEPRWRGSTTAPRNCGTRREKAAVRKALLVRRTVAALSCGPSWRARGTPHGRKTTWTRCFHDGSVSARRRRSGVSSTSPARRRAGDVPGQSADRTALSRRDRVGRVVAAGAPVSSSPASSASSSATLTAIWLEADGAALKAGLYGYNGVLVGLALATFLAPGPALWVYVVLGRRGLDRRDARDRERAETARRAGADLPVRRGDLDHAAGDLRLRRPFRRRPADRGGRRAVRAGRDVSAGRRRLLGGGASCRFRRCFSRRASSRRCSFSSGLAVSSIPAALFALGGRDPRGRGRASASARRAIWYAGAARLQPGADGGRARRDLPPAGPRATALCGARRRVHGRRAGRAQRRAAAVRDSRADGAVHSRLLDVPAAGRAVDNGNDDGGDVKPSRRPRVDRR